MNKNIILPIIKFIDISITGIYFFLGGIIISYFISKITPNYNIQSLEELKKIPSYLVFIHICYNIALITVCAFLLRKCIKRIPFLFDGYMGYVHSDLSELNGTVLLAFALITYVSQDLDNKVIELLRRFNITVPKKKK